MLARLEGEADTGLKEDEILVASIARLRTILTDEQAKGARRLDRTRWEKLLRKLSEAPFEKLEEGDEPSDEPSTTEAKPAMPSSKGSNKGA